MKRETNTQQVVWVVLLTLIWFWFGSYKIANAQTVDSAPGITIGQPIAGGTPNQCLYDNAGLIGEQICGTGAGTVTSVSVTTVNGVSGSVATATTTPAISLTLGAITPTSVNGNTVTTGTGTLTLGSATLNVGAGGTLASGAFAAAGVTALTGDVTATGPGSAVATLASVATAGTTGSSTAIPVVTINAKGLTTSITSAAVVAPAGTLSGVTLASGITASSLTSFGASPSMSGLTVTNSLTATGLITNASLASMSTTTIKGQTVGGSGAPVDLTATQAAAIIGSVGGALKSKAITTTRDLTAVTGSVAYTGMGFTPTACQSFGALSTDSAVYATLHGVSDSVRTVSNVYVYSTSLMAFGSNQFLTFRDVTGSNFQVATISSYDADGLTLSWTKTGTPTGTVNITIMCYR